MGDLYILEGHEPVKCDDVNEWAKWIENAHRHVALTNIPFYIKVSTVFLGIDHNFAGGKPLLFETMIFGGKHDQEMQRYSTWIEAEQGHKDMVKRASTIWYKILCMMKSGLNL